MDFKQAFKVQKSLFCPFSQVLQVHGTNAQNIKKLRFFSILVPDAKKISDFAWKCAPKFHAGRMRHFLSVNRILKTILSDIIFLFFSRMILKAKCS